MRDAGSAGVMPQPRALSDERGRGRPQNMLPFMNPTPRPTPLTALTPATLAALAAHAAHAALAALATLTACTPAATTDMAKSDGEDGPDVAADRSILLYTDDEPANQNNAQLLVDFAGIDQTVCAEDPTRQYLGEVVTHGFSDIQVDWHWAPVVSGPDATRPTVDQPEWWYAGEIASGSDSDDDVLADHPFGLDYSFDVGADDEFDYMPSMGAEEGEEEGLHCEIERGTFPRQAWGYEPAIGGRTLLRGVWVLDCGHPPYGAEMHPPTFLAFAHEEDASTTQALAFVAPYRSSLLFNPDTALADAFDDDARFTDENSLSFPHAFIASILSAVAGEVDVLSSPALMVANHFEPVDMLVCAPLPRPVGAELDAKWHFAARTGVTTTITELPDSGCVRIEANETASYSPMVLPYATTTWSWEQLSHSAGGQLGDDIDVRQAIVDALAGIGIDASDVSALQADNPPVIDAYAPLAPATGADDLSGQVVETSIDTQPFPFYGRVTAAWR